MPRQPKNTVPILEKPRGGKGSRSLLALERDRDATLGTIRELEEAARSIHERGFTARSFDTISSVGATLDEMFRRHEELEEDLLFPELQKIDPALARSFSEEHRTTRGLLGTLHSTIRDIEGGRIHGSSVGDLLRTIRELVTVLRRHIIHEGDVLAPFIRQKSRGKNPGIHDN